MFEPQVKAQQDVYHQSLNTLIKSSCHEGRHSMIESHGLKFLWIPLIHREVVRKGIVFDYTGGDLHEREELGRGHESPLHC